MSCLVHMMLKYTRIVIVTIILIMMENQINNKNFILLVLEKRRFHYKFKVLKIFCFYIKKKMMNKMKKSLLIFMTYYISPRNLQHLSQGIMYIMN